jgi:hypothetical protein
MANQIPLIVNAGAGQIQQLATGDNLSVTANVVTGNILAGGYFYANGQPFSGGANIDLTQVATDIIPVGNNTQSLGNATNQWADLYVSNNTIYMNSVPLTIGTGNVLQVNGANVVSTSGVGNVLDATNLSVTGNITAGFFIGDGSGLTNLPVGAYSNANVAAYLPTYSGNIANLTITGNLTVIGNTVQANIVEQMVTVVGNITAGNLLTANTVSAGGNITAKNISTTGNIVIANGRIDLNGYGNPTFNSVGYGVAGPTSSLNIQAGPDQNIALYTLNSFYSWKFDQAGNLTAPGNVTAAGNVSGNYILGNGSQLTGLPASYSNANVANYLPTYSGVVNGGSFSLADAGALTTSVICQNQNAPYGSEAYGIELLTTTDDANVFSSISAGPDYVSLKSTNAGNANVVLQGGYGITLSTSNATGGAIKNWTFTAAGEALYPGNISTSGNVYATNIVAEASFNIQSSNFNAIVGNRYAVNTTSNPVTATLTAFPITGTAVFFADAGGAFATNNFTINPVGRTIMGSSGNYVVNTNNNSFGLFWNGTTWRTFSNV